jgi:hypothetical protein
MLIMDTSFVKPRHWDKIQRMCLFDDPLMRRVFENNIPVTQLLLRIILEDDTIKVKRVSAQHALNNLHGHSLILDVLAEDAEGKLINIEVQNDSGGASPQRARYHSALLDANYFAKGAPYDEIFQSYVIFITKEDVLKEARPIYHIYRTIDESGNLFKDRNNIVYINGAYPLNNTPLGKLIHDFKCQNPDEMFYKELKNTIKSLKETEEGAKLMGTIVDEILAEGRAEGRVEGEARGKAAGEVIGVLRSLKNAIKNGNMSPEAAMDFLGVPQADRAKLLAQL